VDTSVSIKFSFDCCRCRSSISTKYGDIGRVCCEIEVLAILRISGFIKIDIDTTIDFLNLYAFILLTSTIVPGINYYIAR